MAGCEKRRFIGELEKAARVTADGPVTITGSHVHSQVLDEVCHDLVDECL